MEKLAVIFVFGLIEAYEFPNERVFFYETLLFVRKQRQGNINKTKTRLLFSSFFLRIPDNSRDIISIFYVRKISNGENRRLLKLNLSVEFPIFSFLYKNDTSRVINESKMSPEIYFSKEHCLLIYMQYFIFSTVFMRSR